MSRARRMPEPSAVSVREATYPVFEVPVVLDGMKGVFEVAAQNRTQARRAVLGSFQADDIDLTVGVIRRKTEEVHEPPVLQMTTAVTSTVSNLLGSELARMREDNAREFRRMASSLDAKLNSFAERIEPAGLDLDDDEFGLRTGENLRVTVKAIIQSPGSDELGLVRWGPHKLRLCSITKVVREPVRNPDWYDDDE